MNRALLGESGRLVKGDKMGKKIRVFFSVLFMLAFCAPQASSEEWIKAPVCRSWGMDGGGTYFSKTYSKRNGTFAAIYDSVFDDRDSVSGDFIVGKFRYTYSSPFGGEAGDPYPLHDELIAEVLLDCKNSFSGTAKQIYKYKGKVVYNDTSDDEDIIMIQFRGKTTVGDLCDFLRKHGVKKTTQSSKQSRK